MGTRHDKKRATSERFPLVRLGTCAPHYRRIRLRMRGCRAPAALAPTGAAGFHFGHGSRNQSHFFAIVCGRTTRFETNLVETGPCRSLYRDHESRVRSSFLHRILSRSDGILAAKSRSCESHFAALFARAEGSSASVQEAERHADREWD